MNNKLEKIVNDIKKEFIDIEFNKDSLNKIGNEIESRIFRERNLINSNSLYGLGIAKMISDYLKENNQYVLFRGSLANSYILYKLGVTNVDPIKYNLPPEVLFGINGEKRIVISVNASSSFKDKLFNYIKEEFDDCLYHKMAKNKESKLEEVNGISLLIALNGNNKYNVKESDGKRYIEEEFQKLDNSFISLNICEYKGLDDLEELEKICGKPKTDIFKDNQIINMFYTGKIGGLELIDSMFDYKFNDALDNGLDPLLVVARVSGAEHGTYVINQARELISDNNYINYLKYPLTRDEVMTKSLNNYAVDLNKAYDIMELTRKGPIYRTFTKEIYNNWLSSTKSLKKLDEDFYNYISKIGYLLPLGHALSYSAYHFLEMYYKVYHYDTFYKIKTKGLEDLKDSELKFLYHYKNTAHMQREFNDLYRISLLIEDKYRYI